MRLIAIVSAFLLLGPLSACSMESTVADTDNQASLQNPRIPLDFEVEDRVNAKSDAVDYKIVQSDEDGDAELRVTFAQDSSVVGEVVVYAADGSTALKSNPVTPEQKRYTLNWPVSEDAVYFVKIQADQGEGDYTAHFSVESGPQDPCDDVECGDNEECEEGICVEVAEKTCSPKCAAGLVCVDGTCEKPCGGACPRGEMCNRVRNECVKNPCYGKKCAAGERCVGGTCRKITPVKKQCSPACKDGQTCNTTTGKCEGTATPTKADSCSGPLSASIIQTMPSGSGSILVLNRGTKDCVKVGQTGKIGSATFKITEVYTRRSRANVSVPPADLSSQRSVTINR